MGRLVLIIGPLFLSVGLVSCGGTMTAPASEVPTTLLSETPIANTTADMPVTPTLVPAPKADLSHLTEARSVHIEDDWSGLSLLAPVVAHYDLVRQNGGLAGKGNFSVAGFSHKARTAVEHIVIPADVTGRFLALLSQSPTLYGHYEPKIDHTDDYPSILIEI